jgi:hypothetical protein
VKVPSKRTLAKYGMDALHFAMLHDTQGGCCAVCDEKLEGGRVYIDHEHRRGYGKMPPEEKRKYVRGLCHYACNRFLVCRNTRDTIDMVANYLHRDHPFA